MCGCIRGRITDSETGDPVRATITISPTQTASAADGKTHRVFHSSSKPVRTAVSDNTGRFTVDSLSPGSFTIAASAVARSTEQVTVELHAGETVDVNLALRALPQTLAAMRTLAARSNEAKQLAAPAGVATVSMSSTELSVVPAVGETDVLRAVSLLPGIAARNDFWAGFNIRGGESDQTQVRLDGLPVVSPFHLGGLFSTFISDAVQNVDARVGALPASYSGRLSGVLDVTSAEEERTGIHGAVDITAISTSAKVGGRVRGLFTTAGGSWNVAVRRTYVDALADLFMGKGSFPYHFQDAQFHATTPVRGGGRLAVTAYTGIDLLNPTTGASGGLFADSGTAFRFQWGNRLAGATFTQPIGASAEFVQRVAYSGFGTSYADVDDGARLFNHIGEVRLSGDVTRRIGRAAPRLTLNTGYELSFVNTRYDEHISARAADETFGTNLTIDDTVITQRSRVGSVFGEALWTPNARFSVRGGLRADEVTRTTFAGTAPRLSVKFRATERLSFSAAVGRYAQWTHAVRNEDLPIRIVDIWFVSDSNIPVSTGSERVIGSEFWLSENNLLRFDGYIKTFADLVEPTSTVDPRLRPNDLRDFGGTSHGIEVLLRHVTSERWGGWIAYSYGKSIRDENGESYFAAHDRRHDLNVVASYKTAGRYSFGARLGVASGTPYTGWAGTYSRFSYDPVTRRWRTPGFSSDARNEQARTARNGERYPAYERLDLSAHRAFHIRGAVADAFVNIVNVLDTRNVLAYTIDNAQSPPVLRGLSQLPLLPSLGVRATF